MMPPIVPPVPHERIGLPKPAARPASGYRRIAELARERDSLRQLVAPSPGHGRAEDCPMLHALTGEGRP